MVLSLSFVVVVISKMATQDIVSSSMPPLQPQAQAQQLSLLEGPVDPPLVDLTFGELLDLQCQHHGTQECIVTPWTGARWTYNELNQQSSQLARGLMALGIGVGDRVGIMAGNCEQYASVLFAVARIGAILVILNNTYTPTEAQYALKFSGNGTINATVKFSVFRISIPMPKSEKEI